MKSKKMLLVLVVTVLVFASVGPAVAQKTDTGSIFDGSGGKKPGGIDTDVDISPHPPLTLPTGKSVDTSAGTPSGFDVGKSTGTPSGFDVGKSTGTPSGFDVGKSTGTNTTSDKSGTVPTGRKK